MRHPKQQQGYCERNMRVEITAYTSACEQEQCQLGSGMDK